MYKKFIGIFCVMFISIIGYSNALDFETSALTNQTAHDRNPLADIDSVINDVLQKFNVPGIAVGVVVNNEVILSHGYGVRNREEKLPVTENTLFPVGSCTKAFTTLVLGQLVDEGHLSWDDPVLKYIPEFLLFDKRATREVTVRDLVAHRTGVPRHDAIWFCNNLSRSDVITRLQHLEPVCKLREQWHYNNFMYTVAGILLERITGQTWEEAVYSRVLSPLKMSDSNFQIEHLQQRSNFSLPYAEIDGVVEAVPFHQPNAVEPGGAINSNIVDMLKWTQLQLSNGQVAEETIIRRETLEELHTVQMPFPSNEREDMGIVLSGYGLGWFVGSYRDQNIISHGGAIDGFNAEVSFLPQKNIGIVVLSNSSTDGLFAITSIRNTILDKLLQTCDRDWVEILQKVREKAKQALRDEDDGEQTSPLPSLEAYVGHYEHPAYGDVQIFLENNQLLASYGNIIISLNHDCDNSFLGQIHQLLIYGINRRTEFTFINDSSGQFDEVHISFEPSAGPVIFKRI